MTTLTFLNLHTSNLQPPSKIWSNNLARGQHISWTQHSIFPQQLQSSGVKPGGTWTVTIPSYRWWRVRIVRLSAIKGLWCLGDREDGCSTGVTRGKGTWKITEVVGVMGFWVPTDARNGSDSVDQDEPCRAIIASVKVSRVICWQLHLTLYGKELWEFIHAVFQV